MALAAWPWPWAGPHDDAYVALALLAPAQPSVTTLLTCGPTSARDMPWAPWHSPYELLCACCHFRRIKERRQRTPHSSPTVPSPTCSMTYHAAPSGASGLATVIETPKFPVRAAAALFHSTVVMAALQAVGGCCGAGGGEQGVCAPASLPDRLPCDPHNRQATLRSAQSCVHVCV